MRFRLAMLAVGPGLWFALQPHASVVEQTEDGFLTVAGLTKQLEGLPPNMPVAVNCSTDSPPQAFLGLQVRDVKWNGSRWNESISIEGRFAVFGLRYGFPESDEWTADFEVNTTTTITSGAFGDAHLEQRKKE